MQDEDKEMEENGDYTDNYIFAATIRINACQGLRVASKEIEKHLRNMKMKPIKIKLKG